MFASQSFSSTPAAESFTFSSTSGGPDAKPVKQEEKYTCLPVLVRMVEMADRSAGGPAKIHGIEPSMLILVGMVETPSQQAASLEFTLNDSTGRIPVRYYARDGGVPEGIEAGRYVVIAAELRSHPTVHLSVTSLQLVKSPDEVSYHMIESIHAMLKLQAPRSTSGSMMQQGFTPSPLKPKKAAQELAQELDASPPKELPAPSATVSVNQIPAPTVIKSSQPLQGDALKNAIVEHLKQVGEGLEEGVALQAICAAVTPTPRSSVVAALQVLLSEGEVFNTIDDDHFSAI